MENNDGLRTLMNDIYPIRDTHTCNRCDTKLPRTRYAVRYVRNSRLFLFCSDDCKHEFIGEIQSMQLEDDD